MKKKEIRRIIQANKRSVKINQQRIGMKIDFGIASVTSCSAVPKRRYNLKLFSQKSSLIDPDVDEQYSHVLLIVHVACVCVPRMCYAKCWHPHGWLEPTQPSVVTEKMSHLFRITLCMCALLSHIRLYRCVRPLFSLFFLLFIINVYCRCRFVAIIRRQNGTFYSC